MSNKVARNDEEIIADLIEIGVSDDSRRIIHEALTAFARQVKHDRLRALIQEGEDAYARGEYVEWTPTLMEEIWERAIEMARSGAPIPDHVRP